MGWKAVTDHYRIEHIVQMVAGDMHIGSAYIGDIIVVKPDGTIVKRPEKTSNTNLLRYQQEIDADPIMFERLLSKTDVFPTSRTVYTWDENGIVRTSCDKTGWPNITHDGILMHDNRYSTDIMQVAEWARLDAEAMIRHHGDALLDAEKKADRARLDLAISRAMLARLDANHPRSD